MSSVPEPAACSSGTGLGSGLALLAFLCLRFAFFPTVGAFSAMAEGSEEGLAVVGSWGTTSS